MFIESRRSLVVLSFVVLLCAGSRTSAQQAPVPTPGVIRINVNLVQVDAVVTDGNGRPVTDLKASDFEVLQDGESQKISNFEFVRVKDTLGAMTFRPGALPSPTGPAVAPPPASILKPNDVRRTIALVVDDIGLSNDSTIATREAMRKWVAHEMQPGDLVSVVRTNAAMGALQQFTSDKRLLNAAIDRLKYQPGRVGVERFSALAALAEGIGPADVGFAGGLANAYLSGSINAIRYVMQGLRELPGRKSVILFAEDMNLRQLDTQREQLEERLRRLADEANRSSVVIHSIDPRGVIYTGTSVSDNLSGRTGTQIADAIHSRASNYIDSQDGMVLLAQRTGGLFFAAGNDIVTPLRRAVDDGDGYYLLGYRPDDDTFAPRAGTAKYHAISVRVKRPGLRVRSRTGFFGMTDSGASSPAPQTRQAQIARALISPFTTGDLRVRLTALFSDSVAEGPYLKTLLHFDARDLTFTEEAADGSRSVTVDIALVTFDENGDPAQTVDKTWSLRVARENFEQVLKKGLVYSVPMPVKKPGPYQLRVALRDAASQKLGSAMQFIDVPDVKRGALALSGIVVTAEPRMPDDPEGTPAVRVFKSGGAFSYAYEILNVRPGDDPPRLEARMRLFRDGEIVFDGAPSTLSIPAEKDVNRVAVGGQMALTRVPPGDYVLQVVVLDRERKGNAAVASQSIDFEVK